MKAALCGLLLLVCMVVPAEARKHRQHYSGSWLDMHHHGGWHKQRKAKRHKVAQHRKARHARHRHAPRHSAKVSDLVKPLAEKVQQVIDTCGSKLISGYRRGARIPSGRLSLHAHYPSRAADLQGNPACIREVMRGWPGGMSTDYGRVNHYHISYSPRGHEWGRRFAHYGGGRRARLYAHAQPRLYLQHSP